MSKFLNYPVRYLQRSDFDSNGNIINPDVPKNLPVVLMIQANFCGYCTQAKPDFQQFAEKNKDRVFAVTVQGDGAMPQEKESKEIFEKISPGFGGYPDYVLFKAGRPVQKKITGRSVEDLEKFAFQ